MPNGFGFGTPDEASGGISGLMQNKLFLQYLSAAGQDIAGGEPIGAGVGAVTQQNIAAQSYAKQQERYLNILRGMLAGDVPEGGKMTMDSKGMKIDMPTSLTTPSVPESQVPGEQPRGGMGLINPFAISQPGVSAADLAGLTPRDLSQALQDVVGVETLKQQISVSKTKEYRKTQELLRTAPMEVPGLGKLSFDEWKTLDSKTKAYSYYAFDAKTRGEAVLDYNEWEQQADPTTIEQIFRLAEEDEGFKDFFFRQKRAGAVRISIGEKIAERKAFGELKGQLYFKDPKWTGDLSKHISSEDVQNKIFQAEDPGMVRAEESVRFIESKISAGGGNIEDVKLSEDGKAITWTVRWPSGDVETIRHGVRD